MNQNTIIEELRPRMITGDFIRIAYMAGSTRYSVREYIHGTRNVNTPVGRRVTQAMVAYFAAIDKIKAQIEINEVEA